MEIQEFTILINKLIELGEDKNELTMWQSIFPKLKLEEKNKLLKNLEDELKQLEALKK